MKLELTIKTDYLPTWGVWEGIRELVQNGRDAETEFQAPLKVTHQGQTLRIENEGCTLPHEALLLGHTSKSDRGDMIGKFGEGLKLGILALVRAGRPVKIRSGAEVWTPTIMKSDKFNANVLAFDIQNGREPKSRVRVEIGGVTEVEWEEMRNKFLFLAKTRKNDVVDTDDGSLLMGEAHVGKVFVKGIFVQTSPKLLYGYNFDNVTVDRDRKMINSWDVEYSTQRIWRGALSRRPDLFREFMTLIEQGKDDVKGLDTYAAGWMPESAIEKAQERFLKQFGDDAFPVANINESSDVEHLGKRGVVVSDQMRALLTKTMGDLAGLKVKLAAEAIKVYSYGDLTDAERQNLDSARKLLLDAGVADEVVLDIVDFRSDGLQGLYRGDQPIQLARKLLVDSNETLATMIHEVSHAHGGDGDKGHVAAIEHNWTRVVTYLRKGV